MPMATPSGEATSEGNTQHPMIGGDVSKLFVRTQAAPGVALLVTVHKDTGGGIMTTALTCTVPSGMTTCSDITHSATFADGDLFSLEVDPDGTTTPSVIRFHYVLKFEPTP